MTAIQDVDAVLFSNKIMKKLLSITLTLLSIYLSAVEFPIVNGTETGYKEWKGVVGLWLDDTYICTATLIHPKVLLTAGHCITENGETWNITVMSGSNITGWEGSIVANVADTKTHPTWNGNINESTAIDLALIKLDRDVTNIESYKIRNYPESSIGDVGVVVGYGITASDNDDTGIHRKGTAKILQKGILSGLGNRYLLEVGSPSSTCSGDSGGPFFTMQNNQYVVTGVTSFGIKSSCVPDEDGFEMQVVKYRSWINSVVKDWTGDGIDCLKNSDCSDEMLCSNGECIVNTENDNDADELDDEDITITTDKDEIVDEDDPGHVIPYPTDNETNDKDIIESDPVCGNGVVEGFEQCDDGNMIPEDGCSPLCKGEYLEEDDGNSGCGCNLIF